MVSLASVVAETESANNLNAYRFEPATYAVFKSVDDQTKSPTGALIRHTETLHQCSPDSARVILSSSWGKYQIMGENIWSLGYPGTIWKFMMDDAGQSATFEAFCLRIGVSAQDQADCSWLLDDTKGLVFARWYNGPGSPDVYLARLRQSYSMVEGL